MPNSEVKRECGTAIDGVVVIAKAVCWSLGLRALFACELRRPCVIGIPHVRLTLRGYLIGKCEVNWMEA